MQTPQYSTNSFPPDSGFSSDKITDSQDLNQKNFMDGLQNARSLLAGLEKSIRKTDDYERRLLQCKRTHPHTHEPKERLSKVKKEKRDALKNNMNTNNLSSTMSFDSLQYQHEELTKRYNTLLLDHNNISNILQQRDAQLLQLEARIKAIKAELTNAHEVILIVGEKCLAVTKKKEMQIRKCNGLVNALLLKTEVEDMQQNGNET